ncbi:glycoside hydrolase family 24 protein [Chromobacterium sinusclupearum]|nr:glycoside hydrolase family 104 protein [Chromobacterium sinusclupearum]
MLAFSEGTAGRGDDGYNVVVGGGMFDNGFVDHPRRLVELPRLGIKSTAAGRYQLLARYYDAYARLLGLSNFGAMNQDRIAIQQIRECRALEDIRAGRLAAAVTKCARIWASLPGAGYGQRENRLSDLQSAFVKAGGVLA